MITVIAETPEDVTAIGLGQARALAGELFAGQPYQVIRVLPGTIPAHAAAYGAADLPAALARAFPRRDWVVALYGSDPCPADASVRCVAEAVGPCTATEVGEIQQSVPAGFVPHRVSLISREEWAGAHALAPEPPATQADARATAPSPQVVTGDPDTRAR